jgi:Ca-activated chloride channel homolog
MNAVARRAALLIFAAAGLAQQTPPPGEEAIFRSGVSLVRVDAQVVQGRRTIDGLTKEDFRIADEGRPQAVEYFGRESEPLWVVLLLDVSGSMHKRLDEMAAAARKALSTMGPEDRVSVMFFGRRTHLALDFTTVAQDAAPVIGQGRRNKEVGAGTNINPSVMEAARYLGEKAANRAGRRAIVILTDNEGLNYRADDERVLASLFDADAVLNAIVTPGAKPPEAGKVGLYTNPDFTPSDVFKLARESGGEVLKAEKTGETFQEMMQRIRLRYSLHYRPPAGVSGAQRRIKVELAPGAVKRIGKAEVRARTGYRLP